MNEWTCEIQLSNVFFLSLVLARDKTKDDEKKIEKFLEGHKVFHIVYGTCAATVRTLAMCVPTKWK